jgi:PST family polysaccharide transporter
MSDKAAYGQILKSSSIMGGAAGINLLLGMVRTKFAAVLIGTGGIGLLANFMAIQGMVGAIAGLGLQSSAVRDIVTAVASDDKQAIGRAVLTLRRMCWLTGLLGMSALMALSPILSQWAFGSGEYTLHIALLGFVILFENLSGGQMALIQGMRRIGDIARLNIISATTGTAVAIGFYVSFGLQGIAPSLVLIAAIRLVFSCRFARRVSVPKVEMTWAESFREANGMVRLGVVMVWTGLIASVVSYLTIALITKQINLEAVGIYSAAFALSGMLVNFVLHAMSADYYPRLTAVGNDKSAMNRLVNEQTEIGLLLAVPGLLATISLAPWIIHIFYTRDFLQAVDLLHWFVLGCLGRVISWPLGFVMLALGKAKLFLMTETFFHVFHLALIIGGLLTLGIEGVAIVFSLVYICYTMAVLWIVRIQIGFKWSAATYKLVFAILPVFVIVFFAVRILSIWPATIIGGAITIIISMLCMRELVHRIGHDHRLTRLVCKIPGIRAVCSL